MGSLNHLVLNVQVSGNPPDPCDSVGVLVLWLIYKMGENNSETNPNTYLSQFPLGYLQKDYCLTRGQNPLGWKLGPRNSLL